jgi:hypothetical protein
MNTAADEYDFKKLESMLRDEKSRCLALRIDFDKADVVEVVKLWLKDARPVSTGSIGRASAEEMPIPMRIPCPGTVERDGMQVPCGVLHIDEGEFATKPHHTHACQSCGMVWRPAIVPTVGVRFLPGYKSEPAPMPTNKDRHISNPTPRSVRVKLRKAVTIAGVLHHAGKELGGVRSSGNVAIEFGHGAMFPLDADEFEFVVDKSNTPAGDDR